MCYADQRTCVASSASHCLRAVSFLAQKQTKARALSRSIQLVANSCFQDCRVVTCKFGHALIASWADGRRHSWNAQRHAAMSGTWEALLIALACCTLRWHGAPIALPFCQGNFYPRTGSCAGCRLCTSCSLGLLFLIKPHSPDLAQARFATRTS